MLKRLLTTIWLLSSLCTAQSAETLHVKEAQIPVLIERQDNIIFYMRIEGSANQTLSSVTMEFGDEVNLDNIEAVKLYYSGTEAAQNYGKGNWFPVNYLSFVDAGKTLAANPSYSILKSEVVRPKSTQVHFAADQRLFSGENFFWISLEMKPNTPIKEKVTAKLLSATIDDSPVAIEMASPEGIEHRMGVGVRHAGDDGSVAFRIPGLVTTNEGTLLGVYDVRHNSGVDLQEWVDIGLSRSTDGGQSWEKMILPLEFGEYNGLPRAQNGVGDPAILVDTQTNTVWIVAAWTHGMGNKRAWWSSQPGQTLNTTAQLVMTKSTDDGKTWSAPINITTQVKDPSWYFLLQGPGRGITMEDGTLVFPAQFIGSDRVPNACIIYSKDGGEKWDLHEIARANTTEAQVVEINPGELMLNMRDNSKEGRAVATTKDMGRSWEEHPTSRSALQEPVCQASIISVKAEDNILGRDILIFSNPNTTKGRHSTTLKISFDKGLTWPEEHQLLIDEELNWGYTCLSMVDKESVGILYESSAAQMTFQTINLLDIVKNIDRDYNTETTTTTVSTSPRFSP